MQTIVMTGGSSGLGRVAADEILKAPDTRLLQGARGDIRSEVETLPLDLARLQSVRDFAQAVSGRLGTTPINGLVLNAGTQFPDVDQRTEDGFETTFAVNHLAHYLLLRLLLPKLAAGATVVITTSDTHDPAINPMAPRTLDAELLAYPERAVVRARLAGFRAYSASKLCNLMTARALAASEEARTRGMRVIAYNPGATPGTGLARAWPLWVRAPLTGIAGALSPVLRLATVEQAGSALADLALGRIAPPPGRIYASLVKRRLTWPDPAELAQRDDLATALWDESAGMVGFAAELRQSLA
jgi:NAD(P)-dependent dehydrogenase (short-subunit alcohol dehydrogenase family)